jgi:hypothetical protein
MADRECPIEGVFFTAKGKDKRALEIYIVRPIAPNESLVIPEELVSDKIKEDAKALGFDEIYVKGGKARLLSRATVGARISLR